MPDPLLTIETSRLRLRPFEGDEAARLHEILGDAETMRFYPAPFTRDQTEAWVARQIERYDTDGFGLLVLESKQTGELLGDCGPVVQQIRGEREVELGWHVKRSHWGKGLAPEAGAACMSLATEGFGLSRLVSLIRPVNVPSARVAEKIGMAVERQVDYKGLLHDLYVIEV
jgi:RimJ/RimL family protein N-acetyltransferase